MILAKQDEESKRFDNFALLLHSNPMTDAKARENYIRTIEPESIKLAKVGTMVTDLDQLRRMKAEQVKTE